MVDLRSLTEARVFIIAEIGNNHNGIKETAFRLIDIAAKAGADAVKFQTFTGRDIVSPVVPATEYKGWDVQNFKYWHEFLDSIALPLSDHAEVFSYARSKGLLPFSTPTSVMIVDFLESIGNEVYKIASMDITNIQLLKRVAHTKKPVILSTGMANDDEIQTAIHVLSDNEVAVLHCISDYPTKPENVNLLSLPYISKKYGVITGFSDHSLSNEFAIASVALGGRIIEKHLTYSRNALEKAEHHFALEPADFANLVLSVRNIEKGLGARKLVRSVSEIENKQKYRRGLHLNNSKKAGETLNESDVSVVRPALGAVASEYEFFIGKVLKKDVGAWSGLRKEDLEL